MAASPGTTTGWYPVARAADVGTEPLPVGAGGRAYVLVRLRPHGEVSAFPARCPHRLVPLSAGVVVDGRLTCPYHGWQFDGEGRCVVLPSLGLDGSPPPRADLSGPWAVEERHGWVWLAPDPTPVPTPPRPSAGTRAEPVPPLPAPGGPVLGNVDPALENAWHPVALSRELRHGGWLQVRLLGRTWTLRRTDRLEVDSPAYGVRERLGMVWLAPASPRDVPLEVPEDADRRFVPGRMRPRRSPATAGVLADTFLDVTHAPFLHAGSSGAADHPEVDAYDVEPVPGGFRGVHEQWFDNLPDPGVATGERPLRQRRRVTYVYRAPFQLLLRLEGLDSGAVTTLQYLLQPEDADSTRIYPRLLLSSGPGNPLPAPEDVERATAFQNRVLDEDLALTARLAGHGLPLSPRAELHVPADRLGVALRRTLCDFALPVPAEHRNAA